MYSQDKKENAQNAELLLRLTKTLERLDQSPKMWKSALKLVKSVLQQKDILPDLTLPHAMQICVGFKAMISCSGGDPSMKCDILAVLNNLLSWCKRNLELEKERNSIDNCNDSANDQENESNKFLTTIPSYLVDIQIIPLLCVTLNTLDPELFESALYLLEQLCILSPPNYGINFKGALWSSLSVGILRVNHQNYSIDLFIQFYLVVLAKMKEIHIVQQKQILNYYSSLPDLSDSRVRLVASQMITYCVDRTLAPDVDRVVLEISRYLEDMENALNFKVDKLDVIGLTYTAANEIVLRENQLTFCPPERRIKWTIASLMPYLECWWPETPHLTFLSSIFRSDLKSSVIAVEEELNENLDELLHELVLNVESLFTNLPVDGHDILWETFYELFSFAERREAMGKTGSSKLVCQMTLQPWIEPMLINLVGSTEPPIFKDLPIFQFSQKCLLFIRKWAEMADKQVENDFLFSQLTAMEGPSCIKRLSGFIRDVFSKSQFKDEDSLEREVCSATVKLILKCLHDVTNVTFE